MLKFLQRLMNINQLESKIPPNSDQILDKISQKIKEMQLDINDLYVKVLLLEKILKKKLAPDPENQEEGKNSETFKYTGFKPI